jgi:hypothetical protein
MRRMWHLDRSYVLHSRWGRASRSKWMSYVASLDSHLSIRRSHASLLCRIELPRCPSAFYLNVKTSGFGYVWRVNFQYAAACDYEHL